MYQAGRTGLVHRKARKALNNLPHLVSIQEIKRKLPQALMVFIPLCKKRPILPIFLDFHAEGCIMVRSDYRAYPPELILKVVTF